MKTAVIVHGWPGKEDFFNAAEPSPSNNQWLPWLQKQLAMKGIAGQTPEMPDAYEPNYEKWKSVFELFPLDEETILVGHSCGGGFLVRWLSEHQVKVGQVILVAPWIDPTNELGNDFFDFDIDTKLSDKTVHGVTVFYSTDDDDVILQSVEKIKTIKDIKTHEFSDKGHFDKIAGVVELPEVVTELK